MSGVEVIVKDLSGHPKCPHGPTLLFSRSFDGVKRNFFACSACRDRKHCRFFLFEDELDKITDEKRQIWDEERRKFTETNAVLEISKVEKLSENQRIYCLTCNYFVFNDLEEHSCHKLRRNLSDFQLKRPTEILAPLDNAKKEAQYLFSGTAVQALVEIVQNLGYKQIICIGTPRIHEFAGKALSSILLDLDKRFLNFFPPSQFCWYNCFNHHFFHPLSKNTFSEFLRKSPETALIIDPPFGGRVEPLAFTLNLIRKQFRGLHQTDLAIFWVFPYFMEAQILNSLPEFSMVDYKVDYENHPLFQKGPKGRKMGSPVRIFTNVDLSKIVLPANQGYKYCKMCDRWVAEENRHCFKCNSCTSKDGRTYFHCGKCERCVKPTWKHCDKCQRCAQMDHQCGILEFAQKCFHCKEPGHKKRDCPKVDHEKLHHKRKLSIIPNNKTKKNKNI